MSDTPRTDEAVRQLRERFPGATLVPGDFARQLERENAKLRHICASAMLWVTDEPTLQALRAEVGKTQ